MPDTYPKGNVIFCDDIRLEFGNKPSFMGMYLDHIFLGADFPTALAKLCMYVTRK
jgi:hypothetical protein